MDLTKEYIKMCDCPEIQNRPIGKGDYCFYNGDASLVTYQADYDSLATEHSLLGSNDKVILLPRQDQLQEMLLEDTIVATKQTLLSDFYNWVFNFTENVVLQEPITLNWATNPSFEILWLLFYMDKKHNKYWIDNNWQGIEVWT